jgi:hypothetical protein
MNGDERAAKRKAEYEAAYKRLVDRIDAARPYDDSRVRWNEEKREWIRVNCNADKEKYAEIRWTISRHYQAVLAPEGGSLDWDEDEGSWVLDTDEPQRGQSKTGTFSAEDLAIIQDHFHEFILEITGSFKILRTASDVKLPSVSNELFCKGLTCPLPACAYLLTCKLSERNGKPLLTVHSTCRFNDACNYYEITTEGCTLVDMD